MMYCCASEILALNRMLEFANKNLANLLFEGRRVYFWFVVSFAYAVAGQLLVPDKFYFYNTYGAHWAVYRMERGPNFIFFFNNFFKFGFLTVAYVLMLFFMYRRLRTAETAKISSFQVKVSVQTLAIAVLADGASLGYVVTSYFPFTPAVAHYAGVIGEFLWFGLHAGTGIIYLIMNNAVNRRLRAAFTGGDVFISDGTSTVPHTATASATQAAWPEK
uniref:7TM_GPCR_Srx domain-containing protein n=1 Tax=Steinernema glaseri TaxID=37863 RepID=A0A1I8AFV3_9BILA